MTIQGPGNNYGNTVKVTSNVELKYNDPGFSPDDVLTFTFNDRYRNGGNWAGPVDFKATCTVQQLLNGTTLNFTHQ